MEQYEELEIEVIEFKCADVIRESTHGGADPETGGAGFGGNQ